MHHLYKINLNKIKYAEFNGKYLDYQHSGNDQLPTYWTQTTTKKLKTISDSYDPTLVKKHVELAFAAAVDQ